MFDRGQTVGARIVSQPLPPRWEGYTGVMESLARDTPVYLTVIAQAELGVQEPYQRGRL